MDEKTRRRLLWGLTLAVFALCLWGLYATGFFAALTSRTALEAYIRRCAPWSHLAYFGVQLASVVLAPIPSNITAVAGAVMFGTWPAFLLTWLAVAAGSALVFALARALGKAFVRQLVSKKLSDKYLEVIQRKRDTFLVLAFLFPFFPDDILCVLAGLTDIPFKRFLILVLVTRPWGLLVASALGGAALDIPLGGMVVIGGAGVALFIAAMKYGDRVEEAVLRRLRK